MAADPREPLRGEASKDQAIEDIVAAFLLAREEGENPNVDDWLTRYPGHAEELAKLLTCDTHPPARRTTARAGGAGPGALQIGPYEVIVHVSTAGGGTVYRARHREGGHVVALKVLDTRGAVDPRDVERFRREAAMLRALDLVHVVPVLDTGEDGGRFWIAMKWLEGDTFSKLRQAAADRSHRLHDLRERARLVARVARTFAAIHGYGILHRDVKPSNIMVDRTGEPMIIDFGIAQAPDLPELTATTDQVMGTPRFLAPELIAGGNRQVSPRTDVYGLGLCLYELCTGAEAFKDAARADLSAAIRTTGPAHPRAANPALSHEFAAVILRAIEIDPARRYPDMAAFADDLDRLARSEAPEPATLRGAHPLLRAARRHRKRIVAAVCLLAILIPAIGFPARHALRTARAGETAAELLPFAWFAPEAFAGGIGVPSKTLAGELARNEAATAEQRLLAAWIPFLSGDVKEALSNLGTSDLPNDGFAARLFRDHLRDLKVVQSQGHASGTFLDESGSRPAMNPRTREPYEVLVPVDNPEGLASRDLARFEESTRRISSTVKPETALDRLMWATLAWSFVPNDPRIDSTRSRGEIEKLLEPAIQEPGTRIAALHLHGVMAFLANDLAEARRALETVVAAQPAAIGSRALLGIACARGGDPRRGREILDGVVRDLPRLHPARPPALGQLALAWSASGQADKGVEACARWWTEYAAAGRWQDAVIPRVLAAHIRRDHGDLIGGRNLLIEAIDEEERIKRAEQEQVEKGSGDPPGPLILWKPAFDDLVSVAEALHDQELADEYRAKRDGVLPMVLPKTAEAAIDLNLAGLRHPDPRRALTPLETSVPRNP